MQSNGGYIIIDMEGYNFTGKSSDYDLPKHINIKLRNAVLGGKRIYITNFVATDIELSNKNMVPLVVFNSSGISLSAIIPLLEIGEILMLGMNYIFEGDAEIYEKVYTLV